MLLQCYLLFACFKRKANSVVFKNPFQKWLSNLGMDMQKSEKQKAGSNENPNSTITLILMLDSILLWCDGPIVAFLMFETIMST